MFLIIVFFNLNYDEVKIITKNNEIITKKRLESRKKTKPKKIDIL